MFFRFFGYAWEGYQDVWNVSLCVENIVIIQHRNHNKALKGYVGNNCFIDVAADNDIGNDFSIKMEIETTMNATAWPWFNSAAARQLFWHNEEDKPLTKKKTPYVDWLLVL